VGFKFWISYRFWPHIKWTNKRTPHYACHGSWPFYFVTNPNHRWIPLFGLSLSPLFWRNSSLPYSNNKCWGKGLGGRRERGEIRVGGFFLAYLFKGHLGFYSTKRKRQCLGPPVQFFTKFQNQV
jgi:hypothetical protein